MDLGIEKIIDDIKETYPNLDDGLVVELEKAEVLHMFFMHGLDIRLSDGGDTIPLKIVGYLDLHNSN